MNPTKAVLLLGLLILLGVPAHSEQNDYESAVNEVESVTENQSTQPPPAALSAEGNRSVSGIPLGSDPRLRFHDSPRPKTALSWYNRIPQPKITSDCQGSGKVALSEHCAKYLSCTSKYFGTERACRDGLFFDAVTKNCIQEQLVNCFIY